MKRLLVMGLSVCLLFGASCDRAQVATAVLKAGVAKTASEVVANHWHRGLAPVPSNQPDTQSAALSPLESIWRDLRKLREQNAHSEVTVTQHTIEDLVKRADALIAGYEQISAESLLHSARDAKLTALSIGANIDPAVYSIRRDLFYRELFQAEYDPQTAAAASVRRFVNEHLVKPKLDDDTAVALSRHVTAHPDCDLNVQLYMTTVERLANEEQVDAALDIGSQGLSLCAAYADVSSLADELDQLRAENPGLPGTTMQFVSSTLRGRRFDLTSMRGKPVLVVFWAASCRDCVEEIPSLKDVYLRFHHVGLEIVGVSLDVDRDKLAQFVEEHQLPWPQMFSNLPGNQAGNNPIAKHYNVRSIPQAFLLDENGAVVASRLEKHGEIESAVLGLLSR
ncbi:MAG: TlpA family protein disulfide reductase [Planctomycetaceae bacterium]|nr:TlpA family protein disulfide reductase [Planctomycetales bacterium]MCB9923539.1 TlpA family protein disulfide reductase [Planctomycetaceae bacterium]